MLLNEYIPRSKLVVKTTEIRKPRCAVIDAHNHLEEDFGGGWINHPIDELLGVLDEAGVQKFVDLDGMWGEEILQKHLDKLKQASPERFVVFGGVDWKAWAELGGQFPEAAAQRLRVQAGWGAEGLKVWKPFGLTVKDQAGKRVAVDDTRLDPIWQTAAELNLPVAIHIADPVAFFDPLDQFNERTEELQTHPDWQFPSPPFPPFQQVVDELANLVRRHPQTTFIGAHVACYAENLAWVSWLLDECPNLYVDIAARISELGRQPYTARRFFLKYAERILFGTDAGPSLPYYRTYYRFLETDDEYFNYTPDREIQGQGRWNIYGINLPDEVLEKVYHLNAERVIFNRK
ncbi:MAG TPA: amidohydrolase family protein [Anaerolineaceae bacterium]